MRATIAGSPRFSPDGKLIVFDSRQSQGQSDIFVTPADGGLPRNLTNHPATDSVPTWSRDGRFIYFHSDRNGSSQVWKMRADGSDPRPITSGGGLSRSNLTMGRRSSFRKRMAAMACGLPDQTAATSGCSPRPSTAISVRSAAQGSR